ncbi:MAG: NAD(P)/FAD-dependent oxidoreductase [Pseudomonadota bacterium]
MYRDVVIVGAGHAGAELASTLRRKGFGGSILLVGDEPVAPYERPPLSKACLLGTIEIERILLRESDYWSTAAIELALGCAATALDAEKDGLQLSDGRHVDFAWCVLATGGKVRKLNCPGSDLAGIYYLRTLRDVQAIGAAIGEARRLVVIGGGFIGLEVAAAARQLGKEVALIETQRRVLARVTSPVVSSFYEALHRQRGVRLLLGSAISGLEGEGQVSGVRLADGTVEPADLVVVGIGIDADTGLAEQAGLACDAGILVDEACRTSQPRILAIGDCSRHPNDFAGGLWRLESVQHANDSAGAAADTILGNPGIYREVPTFWSDQYECRLQTAGLTKDADEIVVRGDAGQGPFSVVYLQEGRVVAVDAINAPKDFMAARHLVRSGARPDRKLLADPSIALKSLA